MWSYPTTTRLSYPLDLKRRLRIGVVQLTKSGRRLTDWLPAYLEYTSHTESPTQFHLWTAVFTIAGALGRKVWLEDGDLVYYPNFYIIFVGPPGVARKSSSISIGQRILRQVPLARFAPNSTSWQALLARLSESTISIPIGDGHIARIADGAQFMGESLTMSCISAVAKELGPFMSLKNAEMLDVMTDLWDGTDPKWERKTLQHGDHVIQNPWINLIAATTPTWLRENTTEGTIGGGFASRCIFIYGDRKQHLVPYQSRLLTRDHKELYDSLVHDLQQISEMLGSVRMTEEAYRWGEHWYLENERNPPPGLIGDRYEGVLARRQTMMHKLALVLLASGGDRLEITPDILARADRLLCSAESTLPMVFNKVGMSIAARSVNHVVAEVRRHHKIERRRLLRILSSMSPKEVSDALAEGAMAGDIQEIVEGQTLWVYYTGEPEPVALSPDQPPAPNAASMSE